jgi:glucosamine--fructose-6-phosphate aminotransferase (isomerizing)
MCGIVGFAKKDSLRDLYEGLTTLEYRGYDSVGVAYIAENKINIRKKKGRVDRLRAFLYAHTADICLGHTRWATHGAPSAVNAHPHAAGRIAIVHNGIVSNYLLLRRALEAKGRRFASETDSEVIAHLIDDNLSDGDVLSAIAKATEAMQGNWAVAVLYEGTPDCVYLFKKGNPLIVGKGQGFCCFASDTPALVRFTQTIYKMGDGEIARIEQGSCAFWRGGVPFEPTFAETTLRASEVDLGAYPTFMVKEMAEIPRAVADTWRYMQSSRVPNEVACKRLVLVGCGTAYHACLYAERLQPPIPTQAVVASEFDAASLDIGRDVLVVAVSQSGETADTLGAVRQAKAAGARVVGITNVPQSGLTAAVDECIVTRAGAEIAVAATKSYVTQMLAIRYLLSQWLGEARLGVLCDQLTMVTVSQRALDQVAHNGYDNVFLLAKGGDYATCLEGALKIKEVAYLPCETCYAGEIKHGPLACVTKKTLVVAVCTEERYVEKMKTALCEVATRGAKTLVISTSPDLCHEGRWGFLLPQADADWTPLLAVLPLQYLAYRLSVERGIDPDKPRNLAKSVTVE